MKSRTVTLSSILFFSLIAFGFGYFLGQSPWAPYALFGAPTSTPAEAKETFAPFWEVWSLVHTRYYDLPVDDTLLAEGAIDGMLAALGDDHTRYLSPADEEAARQSMSGEFQGIGAEVESRDDFITVVSPIEGSPAEAAGLLPGDHLLQADGVDLTGMDVVDAAALVRGPAGTAVLLLVQRGEEQFELGNRAGCGGA
ncbi:MAG: PDZ domain-containing protein [Chloroflexi bacterium]|nr:PDZ domain-containing protein [Chloroflexota bacterium]